MPKSPIRSCRQFTQAESRMKTLKDEQIGINGLAQAIRVPAKGSLKDRSVWLTGLCRMDSLK